MLGWFRLAAACASRRNRSTNDGSRAYSGKSAFERDRPVQRLVAGEVHLGHTALRDLTLDLDSGSKRPGRPATWWRNPICPFVGLTGCARHSDSRAVAFALRPEQRAEHLRGDRRGDPATGRLGVGAVDAAVLDEHRDRVLRVVGRRERDEPGVRRSGRRRSPRCRSCPRPGRPGSARRCRCPRCTTCEHELLHRRRGRGLHRPPPLLGAGSGARRCRSGLRSGRRRAAARITPPVATDFGDERHLERRHRDRALADRGLREQRLRSVLNVPGCGSDAARRSAGSRSDGGGVGVRRRSAGCRSRAGRRGRGRPGRTSCCTTR